MNKSFYAFRRFGQATSQSTNGRVEDLLTKLSLEDRMISGAENPCDIRQEIDYTEVMRKLDVWRTESMDYLTTALHATGECI